ncbi:triphosphoribosyl-dephospho-CoA synthase CitG [Lacrimispora amygdalina]|uniref:Probable 2-(5''-triphosphoribosyl)-3'-dephosphocoenzyme-A synthase n=1 Tax=Lacrimispora amygdalina TaxID=253257 RepID=A0A3E2NEE6_9FIRM|nr:triphosphoribosyl-dephospho-CoA synthase CitG [Clostridium indicum]RFZ79250.1 triphosphoribosyl-dephospho-CoA synthase CitG [Clostridium indicum]
MQSRSCVNVPSREEEAAYRIGNMAYRALLEEVYTLPKPGLVDPYSNGAHTDMNVVSFERSAKALKPYFVTMALEGERLWEAPPVLFETIRRIGILAERAMYQATGGVNTHKGLVFHLGILCGAAGACHRSFGRVALKQLMEMEQAMVRNVLVKEVQNMETFVSKGEKNLQKYGLTGARGEAISGYFSVFKISLPVMSMGLYNGQEWNRVKLETLFHLMSQVDDSNILSRHNPKVLNQVKKIAAEFLKAGGAYRKESIDLLKELDKWFVKKNISAGGSADLLAVTIFLTLLTGEWGGLYGIHETGRQTLSGERAGAFEGVSCL